VEPITESDVFTIRMLVSMADETFDAFLKDLRARRKEHAKRAETAQREAEASAKRLITPPKVLAQREEWARANLRW
jgi:hypothetical protein